MLILGSGSEMSRTLAPVLSKTRTLIGVDTCPGHVSGYSEIVSLDINDKENLTDLMIEANIVINVVTGVKSGWQGLVDTEMLGTKTILEASINSGIHRLIHISSLHSQSS